MSNYRRNLQHTQNVIDTVSYYSSTSNMIPSPYAADESFYSDYIHTISGKLIVCLI